MELKIERKRGITIRKILFSVLVPVYNVEKYLEKCIDSVLKQTYPYFEVILIDDGSTDQSGSICDWYARSDYRVRVYHQSNHGLIMARRNAIAKARGNYFLFLDSDDYWDTDVLETINKAIIDTGCDMVIFNYKKVTPSKSILSEPVFENGTIFEYDKKQRIFEEVIKGYRLNNLWMKAVKNSIVDYSDYFKYRGIKYAEDLLQSLPLLYNARRILYLDKPMYNYRMNPQSITHNFNFRCMKDITIVRGVVLNYMTAMNMRNATYCKLFYLNYVNILLAYLSDLCNSNIRTSQKKDIMRQAQNLEMYNNAQEYITSNDLSKRQRIRLYLFQKEYYGQLILFEKMIHFAKKYIPTDNLGLKHGEPDSL